MYLLITVSFCLCRIMLTYFVIPYGLVVRIPGFHPGGPGSTPGMWSSNFSQFLSSTGANWVESIKVRSSSQLYYENFLMRYDLSSEESTEVID